MSLPRLRLPIILGTSIFIAGSWIVFDFGSFPCAAAQTSKTTKPGPGSVEVNAFTIVERKSNEPKPAGNDVAIHTRPDHLDIAPSSDRNIGCLPNGNNDKPPATQNLPAAQQPNSVLFLP